MIITKNLTKKYNEQFAVDGLNLKIEDGVSYGLLGPNGAGKTTTIKMISTLLEPTSGEIFINDTKMHRENNEIKKEIGLVSQHFSLQREMTPVEVLNLHGMLHKMPRKERKKRIDQLISFAGMDKDRKKLVGKLSGGNKRKLMIIRAVMHNPKILFLDEPTVGLDATIRRSIWDLLKKLKEQGMTILITTHYIDEARILCDTIGMMKDGKIICEHTPEEYLNSIKPYVVEIFDGDFTEYKYFDDRQEAGKYCENISESVIIRKSNLEDVYVKYTQDRL